MIHWKNGVPYSEDFNDTYYSREHGLAESKHVFIKGNGLPQRWLNGENFSIIETGFGTGLNFLCTCYYWQQHRALWLKKHTSFKQQLFYFSIEKYPLSAHQLTIAHQLWPELKWLSARLRQSYPLLINGLHRINWQEITLFLYFGDVDCALAEISHTFDAWFADGFSPHKNDKMWNESVCHNVAKRLKVEATFATFTVARPVKNILLKNNFALKKIPGWGRKREILTGKLTQSITPSFAPWYHLPKHQHHHDVIIIGAGFSGTAIAYQLAQRGFKVTLLDKGTLGNAASGNPIAIAMPVLTVDKNNYGEYYRHAFLAFQRFANRHSIQFTPTAVDVLGYQPHLVVRYQKLLKKFPDLLSVVTDTQYPYPAWRFTHAGWIKPKHLVSYYIKHSNIDFVGNREVLSAIQHNALWTVKTTHAQYQSKLLIIAAPERTFMREINVFPLYAAKGTLTIINTVPQHPEPVVCYNGYLLHDPENTYVGATYQRANADRKPLANIETLAQILPDKAKALRTKPFSERTATRYTTPDHLPIIGAIPDLAYFQHVYHDLHHGKQYYQYPLGLYQSNLLISTGHGSRGVISSYLAAQLIAEMVNEEPLSIEKSVLDSVNPARFIIRKLKTRP